MSLLTSPWSLWRSADTSRTSTYAHWPSRAPRGVAVLKLQDLSDSLVIFTIAFGAYLDLEAAANCCTSSWRRMEDTMIPPRVKIAGLYVNSVLAKTEATLAGFDEAILPDLRRATSRRALGRTSLWSWTASW